jgi:nucleotide-binding universal stress UspA family protein
MKPTSTDRKILWALDAFDESKANFAFMVNHLTEFSRAVPSKIYPVYVLSPDQLNLNGDFTEDLISQYAPAATRALEQKLKAASLASLQPALVVSHTQSSLKTTVDKLIEYVTRNQFDEIVVGSHGRKGFERLVLGSFAEEVLLRAPVPVSVISANADHAKYPLNNILYPCDLTEASRSTFDEIIALAARFEAKVTLFHSIPRPIEPVLQSGVYLLSGAWMPHAEFEIMETAKQTKFAENYKTLAQKAGVRLEAVFDRDCLNASESILKYAEAHRPGVIAMAAQSKRLSAAFLGSVCRQVVRGARCPVWVVRNTAASATSS